MIPTHEVSQVARAFRAAPLPRRHRPGVHRRVRHHARDAFGLATRPASSCCARTASATCVCPVPVNPRAAARLPAGAHRHVFSRSNYGVRQAIAPYIDHAWRYDKTLASAVRLLGAIRAARYDVVVDLMDNPSVSAQLVTRWCGARYRLGIRHERAGHYTHAVPLLDRRRVHIVERMAQLLLPFGIDPTHTPLELEYRSATPSARLARTRLGPSERPLRLAINISASSPSAVCGEG